MPQQEVEDKARDLLAQVLGAKRTQTRIETGWNIERVNSVRTLRTVCQIDHKLLILLLILTTLGVYVNRVPSAKAANADYPTRPVRLIVPFAPGGGNDTLSRSVALQLTNNLGQQFVVDNRAGAGGVVGGEIVAKATPDGYTLLMGSSSLAVNASLIKNMPHHPIRDFTPIALVGATTYLLAVHPAVPVKSVTDLITLAKTKPGGLNYASGGIGSPLHLAAELFRSMTATQFTHLPYKGGVPAVSAVIAGEAQLVFGSITTTIPAVKGNRVRAIAVTGAKRSVLMPELPTVAESGVPGYESTNWYGVLAPAKTPAPVVNVLNAELKKILSVAELRERMTTGQGIEPHTSTPLEFSAYLKAEVAKWANVVKQAGIQTE